MEEVRVIVSATDVHTYIYIYIYIYIYVCVCVLCIHFLAPPVYIGLHVKCPLFLSDFNET